MMRRDRSIVLPAILMVVGAALSGAAGASGVEAPADRILRQMSDYLKTAGEFTFRAHVAYDSVMANGEEIEYGGTAEISVRRPDRLHVVTNGDERRRRIFFDGRTITMYDVAVDVYAVTEVPPEIDAAVDLVFDKYGLSVPIADLVYSDPYSTLTENVETGYLAGLHSVDGTPCHHLAFSQEVIDWQIWIEAGPRPVPRKLVITYKDEPGAAQFRARFVDWNFQPRLSDHYFEFHPPEGADQIEFLAAQPTETQP